jgi:hypothetical protein
VRQYRTNPKWQNTAPNWVTLDFARSTSLVSRIDFLLSERRYLRTVNLLERVADGALESSQFECFAPTGMRLSADEQHRRAAAFTVGLKNTRSQPYFELVCAEFPIGDVPRAFEFVSRRYYCIIRGWRIGHLYLGLQAPERKTVGVKQALVE